MSRPQPICQRFPVAQGESLWDNELGRYFAAWYVESVPQESCTDYRMVSHGYAVGIGKWYFFDALEPAIAFGRAARMSLDCYGYGVYEAAHETQCCPEHGDEFALHLIRGALDRKPDEARVIRRFAQGVEENPYSAYWHEPTGFIRDQWGEPTRRRSHLARNFPARAGQP